MGGFAFELEADETAVLELKLGQYIKGDQGATGPTGPAGPQGELSPDDKDYITQQASIAQTAANNANGSATSAAQSASQAQTASTQAQAARDAASQSATSAQTAATNATNSAANAATSATNAQTQATNAAASAAAALASQNAASGSATNAATSAAAALASQNAAATSATNAKTSETNAAASAAAASASQTAAAGSAASAATDAQRAEDAADVATGVGGEYEIDLTAGNVTLDDSLSGKGIYRLVGTPNADRTVTFSGLPNAFVVHNLITTGFAVTLKTAAGTATAFAQSGDPQNFMADATGVYATSATAQSTAPNSIWYTVGASDAVGSFAAGDTFIRTPGFVPPFVRVIRNGAQLTRGQHYTLRADNIHVDFVDPLTVNDEIDLQTQATASASSVVNPALAWLQPAAGATFVPFTHTIGFAWPLLRGVFLESGTDYTEDATGFYLVGFAMDGVEKIAILALGVATLADVLTSNEPAIKSGGLHFVDGSVQVMAAPAHSRFINGDFRVNQRNGTVGALGLKYCIDRWYVYCTGVAVNFRNDIVGPTGLPCVTMGGVAGNTACNFGQRIESRNIADLAGLPITVSGWMYKTFGPASVPVLAYVPNATDNFSANVSYNAGTVAHPGGLWLPFRVPYTLPATATRGLQIEFQAGALINGDSFSFADVKIEPGTNTAPVFERIDYQQQFAACRRYYQNVPNPGGVGASNTAAGVRFALNFPGGTMRANPAITFYGTWNYYGGTGTPNVPSTSINAEGVTPEMIQAYYAGSGFTSGQAGYINTGGGGGYSADAEL